MVRIETSALWTESSFWNFLSSWSDPRLDSKCTPPSLLATYEISSCRETVISLKTKVYPKFTYTSSRMFVKSRTFS